jgi:hypothetical protein
MFIQDFVACMHRGTLNVPSLDLIRSPGSKGVRPWVSSAPELFLRFAEVEGSSSAGVTNDLFLDPPVDPICTGPPWEAVYPLRLGRLSTRFGYLWGHHEGDCR